MGQVKILRLGIMDREPDENGARIIALFDCRMRGVKLEGCALWLAEQGYITLGHPRRRLASEHHIGACVVEAELQVDIIEAAHAAAVLKAPNFPPLVLSRKLQRRAETDPAAGLRKFLSASAR